MYNLFDQLQTCTINATHTSFKARSYIHRHLVALIKTAAYQGPAVA